MDAICKNFPAIPVIPEYLRLELHINESQNHRMLRLESTTTMFTTKPCAQVPHLHFFWTLPAMMTPLPWKTCCNALCEEIYFMSHLNLLWCNLRTVPPCSLFLFALKIRCIDQNYFSFTFSFWSFRGLKDKVQPLLSRHMQVFALHLTFSSHAGWMTKQWSM